MPLCPAGSGTWRQQLVTHCPRRAPADTIGALGLIPLAGSAGDEGLRRQLEAKLTDPAPGRGEPEACLSRLYTGGLAMRPLDHPP